MSAAIHRFNNANNVNSFAMFLAQRRGAPPAMHQARLIIHTDIGLHVEVPLISFLVLMHFRVVLGP